MLEIVGEGADAHFGSFFAAADRPLQACDIVATAGRAGEDRGGHHGREPCGVELFHFDRGQRLLGLDRLPEDTPERLVEILCFPIDDPDRPITRLPGRRARRFFLHRSGPHGRLHFVDGTATAVDFVIGRDEPRVVEWIGLPDVPDNARLCLDLAARPLEPEAMTARRAPEEGPDS